VELEDGPTASAEVERAGDRRIEVTIREGRKRQVRRMAEAVGNEVTALRRARIGPLELGTLPDGGARRLGKDEVRALWEDSGG
jgi:23S rRNA pseudouridine2605 synthase